MFGLSCFQVEITMDLRTKLTILADAAKYDASCASSGSKRKNDGTQLGDTNRIGICHSYTPDGRCVSLLKILLTNYCMYDCQYCVNRITSETPRARFTVEEVVNLTIQFYKRNYIEGLFLSSGIIQSVDYTMEQLIAVAKLLRTTHRYNGYIHLKAAPGASPELLAEAGRWADRLSANVELPTSQDLKSLAPEKKMEALMATMTTIKAKVDESRAERKKSTLAPIYAPAGQSTQMIVGATPTPDAAILSTSSKLYGQYNLRRVYYSAYSPIPFADSRLPAKAPPLVREHRLYQADWLMRFYYFEPAELTTAGEPNLDLSIDPKLAWALRNREWFPVDLNRADRSRLLRIPGLGVRNVNRILSLRRYHKIRLQDLVKLRVAMRRVRPFVITADHNPDVFRLDAADLRARITGISPQLNLFETGVAATFGEL
jgi:putative DNA modification/repair radical SAM protein